MTIGDPTLEMHAFLVTRGEGQPVNAAPEEHDDLRWFRPSDLADLKMAHPASLSSILSAVQAARLAATYRPPSGQKVDVESLGLATFCHGGRRGP